MNNIIKQKVKKNKQNKKKIKNIFSFNLFKKTKEKILIFFKSDNIFFILLIIFFSSFSFFLGKISIISNLENLKNKEIIILEQKKNEKLNVFGSKKGSVYYMPWCNTRISQKNKIIFKDKEEAEQEGYRASKRCEGL